MSIAAVVLAAGASSRLGEAKQLLSVGGERLLDRAVRVAREAGLSPIIVVLGSKAAEIAASCDLRDALVVRCERWDEGMSRSLQAGIEAAAKADRVEAAVVMTADMPFVTAEHLRALARKKNTVRASRYGGRNGVPAHFPRAAFAELLRLEGDAGARKLLGDAASVELGEAALDVDTAEDLAEARRQIGVAKRLRRGAR
jgi:CTP:molybdopterin cytidylyltransferase MocA